LTLTDPAFGYQDLGSNKGSIYKQGTYGDVKLLAGGAWINSAACGSRFRLSVYYRWHTHSNFGARLASDAL
jgi:hypothetical protein